MHVGEPIEAASAALVRRMHTNRDVTYFTGLFGLIALKLKAAGLGKLASRSLFFYPSANCVSRVY